MLHPLNSYEVAADCSSSASALISVLLSHGPSMNPGFPIVIRILLTGSTSVVPAVRWRYRSYNDAGPSKVIQPIMACVAAMLMSSQELWARIAGGSRLMVTLHLRPSKLIGRPWVPAKNVIRPYALGMYDMAIAQSLMRGMSLYERPEHWSCALMRTGRRIEIRIESRMAAVIFWFEQEPF